MQETFVRLLRQRTYRSERPFRPWLFAIASNVDLESDNRCGNQPRFKPTVGLQSRS